MKIMLLTSFEISKSEFDNMFPSPRIDALINKPVSIKKFVDAVNALMVSDMWPRAAKARLSMFCDTPF